MRQLSALTVCAVLFHVFMEWLFFVTKPSFLSPLATGERLLIPWVASFPLLAAALVLLLVLAVLRIGRAVPALVLAATLLLLADNFSRTVFDWGSGDLTGVWRGLPLLAWLLLAVLAWRWMGRWEKGIGSERAFQAAALVLFLIATGTALFQIASAEEVSAGGAVEGAAGRRPNILILGSDGLNAERTSLFGYDRETTPFLERFAREALVFENAFPNGASTASSTVSMLTSRLPTETGVIYPPDIAKGDAAYQHLPMVLRKLGYRTGQISVRWYADGPDLNLQNAFDWANSRRTAPAQGGLDLDRLGQSSAYFLSLMRGRLEERLLALLAAEEDTRDAFREVRGNTVPAHGDDRRLRELFDFIETSGKPFFAHVHLMGTHGGTFKPRQRIFSAGKDQNKNWMTDFYDDAVVDFDRSLEQVVGYLRERGILDRTILVIYSDHGKKFTTLDRLPLLIRFPGGARAGRVGANAQNLDVAPTLLDALGIEPPSWMEGTSLLRGQPDPCRWIVSAKYDEKLLVLDGTLWSSVPRPPWYTLRSLSVISGRHGVTLDLPTGKLKLSRIKTWGDAGAECPAPEPGKVRGFLLDHLRENGYKVPG